MASVKNKFDIYNIILKNNRSIATFFALLEYFYSKKDQLKDIPLK